MQTKSNAETASATQIFSSLPSRYGTSNHDFLLRNERHVVMDRVLVKMDEEGSGGIMDDCASVIAEGPYGIHGLPESEGQKLDLLVPVLPRQV